VVSKTNPEHATNNPILVIVVVPWLKCSVFILLLNSQQYILIQNSEVSNV
jgi:hypothetical protein